MRVAVFHNNDIVSYNQKESCGDCLCRRCHSSEISTAQSLRRAYKYFLTLSLPVEINEPLDHPLNQLYIIDLSEVKHDYECCHSVSGVAFQGYANSSLSGHFA